MQILPILEVLKKLPLCISLQFHVPHYSQIRYREHSVVTPDKHVTCCQFGFLANTREVTVLVYYPEKGNARDDLSTRNF